jgi:hypothetical protein
MSLSNQNTAQNSEYVANPSSWKNGRWPTFRLRFTTHSRNRQKMDLPEPQSNELWEYLPGMWDMKAGSATNNET